MPAGRRILSVSSEKQNPMRKYILGAFGMLLAAVAHPATEQTAVAGKRNGAHVSGTVTDARTGTGLAYATLAVKGTTVGIAADASGRFTLNDLPTGRLTLIAAAVGYKSAEQELRLEAGETVRADFALEEEALAVEEIVVSASRSVRDLDDILR